MLTHPSGISARFQTTFHFDLPGGVAARGIWTTQNNCLCSVTCGAGWPHVGLCPIFLVWFMFDNLRYVCICTMFVQCLILLCSICRSRIFWRSVCTYRRFGHFVFVPAQNWHYFYFLFEICRRHRFQLHRFTYESIEIVAVWIENVLVDFWPFFTVHVQNSNFRASGYNSHNAVRFSASDNPITCKSRNQSICMIHNHRKAFTYNSFGYFSLHMRRNGIIGSSGSKSFCHNLSQRHWFPINVLKCWRFHNSLVDFRPYFAAHAEKQLFPSFRPQFWQRH